MTTKLAERYSSVSAGRRSRIIAVVLVFAPLGIHAANPPGYEHYPEGDLGYLGDGIVSDSENATAELARAVQNPVADAGQRPLSEQHQLQFRPAREHAECTQHLAGSHCGNAG